jgi:hypothetical protein
MPAAMIAKCSEALALRKAFPADLSGVYSTDEMDQAVEPVTVIPQHQHSPPSQQVTPRSSKLARLLLQKLTASPS